MAAFNKNNDYDKGKMGGMKPRSSALPVDYLKNGYTDESGELDIKLLTSQAEHIGKALGDDGTTSVSKIRSFYDSVTSCLTDITYEDAKWTMVRNNISLLKARANARFEKGTASRLFLDFISKNVDLVTESKSEDAFRHSLRNFKDHFEAVVCYLPKK